MDGSPNGLFQLAAVQCIALCGLPEVVDQIDGAQVARLIGQQRLLSAGVGGLDFPLSGAGVVSIQAIQEDDAGFTRLPGGVDNGLEHRPGVELSGNLLGCGVHKIIAPSGLHSGHEGLGKTNGDVEVGNLLGVVLAGDKVHDIGVVHPENAHIGPPAGAALLHRLGGGVEDLHKGDGAAGNTPGGVYRGALGPQPGEGKTGAAAGLVDQGGVLDGVEDVLHGVLHRKHEAGRELSQRTAGVHEGGGVGEKVQAGHQVIKEFGRGRHIGLGVEARIGCGDRVRHPVKKLVHRLNRLSVLVTDQIAPLQDGAGIFGNGHISRSSFVG